MPANASFSILRLGPGDTAVMDELLTTFGEAFEDTDTCGKARPSVAYMR